MLECVGVCWECVAVCCSVLLSSGPVPVSQCVCCLICMIVCMFCLYDSVYVLSI